MSNRPRNWHDMDEDAKQDWTNAERRNQAAIDDLEFERDEARRACQRDQRRAEEQRRRERRIAEENQQNLENGIEALEQQCLETSGSLEIAVRFIEMKGLKEEYLAYDAEQPDFR